MSALDKQEGGQHYQLPIQPIEYIVKNSIPYREANVIKYVTRHASKNGAEDIKKAIHYLEMILEDYAPEDVADHATGEWCEWIEWNGGECPVPPQHCVEVEYWDGLTFEYYFPENAPWTDESLHNKIMRYRVRK